MVFTPIVVILVFLMLLSEFLAEFGRVPLLVYAAVLTMIIKVVCWFGGLLLLIPVGIIDLIVGHSKRPAETAVASALGGGDASAGP